MKMQLLPPWVSYCIALAGDALKIMELINPHAIEWIVCVLDK